MVPRTQHVRPLTAEERSAARRVGERLRSELVELVRQLPPENRGGAAMARELGVDRSTCQRVLSATRTSGDAVEVLLRVPGTEGLDRFVGAFAERGTAKELLRGAEESLVAFARLVEKLAGSRTALARRIEAVGSTSGERIGEEEEAAAREQVFEALRVLTGAWIDVQTNVLIVRPVPTDTRRVEVVGARDVVGLSGRSGAPPVAGLYFAQAHQELPEGQPRPVPLSSDGAGAETSTLLPEFSSDPLPEVVTREVGDVTLQLIEPPGTDAEPIDVALAHRLEPPILHPALQDDRRLDLYYHCVAPTRRTLLHAYLHRSLASRCLAEAQVHQRSVELRTESADPWFDQLEQRMVVEILGSDIAAAEKGASQRQTRLLEHLFRSVGWNPREFVGFRLALDHPLWACRYTMTFEFGPWAPGQRD